MSYSGQSKREKISLLSSWLTNHKLDNKIQIMTELLSPLLWKWMTLKHWQSPLAYKLSNPCLSTLGSFHCARQGKHSSILRFGKQGEKNHQTLLLLNSWKSKQHSQQKVAVKRNHSSRGEAVAEEDHWTYSGTAGIKVVALCQTLKKAGAGEGLMSHQA